MELTKNNIVSRINKLLVTYKITWDDIKIDLDMAIDEINTYMTTKYPHITDVLDDFCSPEKTYSYRVSGINKEFFPLKYFLKIVIPFVVTQVLTREEDFSFVFSRYSNLYQESLFVMAQNEMSSIPYHLIDAPKGVYFANPNPRFKEDPQGYFNRVIAVQEPRLKVTYSWGEIKKGFVARPLPVDNNSYAIDSMYAPVVMQTNEYLTLIVDEKQTVIATFIGWSFQKNGENRTIITQPFKLEEDVTLYAVFNYDIIKFIYNGNGGSLSNWKPLYVNKGSIPEEGIIPVGGTAIHKGHTFIGFDPIKINKKDIQQISEIDMTDGFSAEELALINDTSDEPEIEFTAQWNKILYKLQFNVSTEQGRSGYLYGEEFDLLPPVNTAGFVGWWDNPNFNGSPVTKIFESDTGDKMFYAKYNIELYKITWMNYDGVILKEENLPRNAFLIPPQDPTKENETNSSGLSFSYRFKGFFNVLGVKVEPSFKVVKTETFVASFEPIPITRNIFIKYKNSESGYEEESLIYQNVQIGATVNTGALIGFLHSNDKHKFENDQEEYEYVGGFSLNLNPLVSFGNSFIMPSEDITIWSIYSDSTIDITFHKVVAFSPFSYETTGVTIKVAKGINKNQINFIAPFSKDETNVAVEISKTSEEWALDLFMPPGFTGTLFFEKFIKHDLTELPTLLEEDIILVPKYSFTKLINLETTLTIIGAPLITNGTTNIIRKFLVNEFFNIPSFKAEFDNNLFRSVEDIYFNSNFNEDSKVLSDNLNMQISRTVYAKTALRSEYSIIFYPQWLSPSAKGNPLKVADIFEYQLNAGLSINPESFGVTQNYSQYLDDGRYFDGWTIVEDSQTKTNNVFVDTTLDADVIFYPVLKIGSFTFATIIKYEKGNNFPTIIEKTMQNIIFGGNLIDSTQKLYDSKNNINNILNNLNQDSLAKYYAGYVVSEYKRDGELTWSPHWPIYVNLNNTKINETRQVEVSLSRNTTSKLITIENIYSLDCFVSTPHEREYSVFIPNNRIFSVIKADYLPTLKQGYFYKEKTGNIITDDIFITRDYVLVIVYPEGFEQP